MTDFLVIGQGLAGTALAWQLHRRGASFQIIDREAEHTSSTVAAGIVNPITGRYFAKSWRIDESWPVALAFYRAVERITGARFFHEMPVVRLLASDDEAARWAKQRVRPGYAGYLSDAQPQPLVDPEFFAAERGGFQTTRSGYLDVGAFLAASRAFFAANGNYRAATVRDDAVRLEPLGWSDVRAGRGIVFCQGHDAAGGRFFDWVPFKSAKGEILTLVPDRPLPRDRIVNGGGVWLLPDQSQPGVFRAGSTYSWDPLDTQATESARVEILQKLSRICRVRFDVVGQSAAVRPIIRASKALIGRHPAHPQLALFNGLGSKGVLNAPFFSAQLAGLLLDETPVDDDVDLCKNNL